MTPPASAAHERAYALFSRIIELSDASTWERAKKEWVIDEVFESDEPDTCLCGHHPIIEICVLSNWKTGAEVSVGNCCVRHFLGFGNVGRIMAAIRQRRINADLIDHVFDRGIIDGWERDFLLSTWRKRKLTTKQATAYNRIHSKIFSAVVGGDLDGY